MGRLLVALLCCGPHANAENEDYTSVMSCKFGPNCTIENFECSDYETWLCVRRLETTQSFSVVNCGVNYNKEVTFRNMASMVIFDWYHQVDDRYHASAQRLVVSETGEATLQHAFTAEIVPGDPKFFSGSKRGICKEIQ